MLTVLGGLAEFECELIRARTSEGRVYADFDLLGTRRWLTPRQSADDFTARGHRMQQRQMVKVLMINRTR
jgi:hypothetical protein